MSNQIRGGGGPLHDTSVSHGTVVTDTEDPDPRKLVVVNTPGLSIEEWDATPGTTVADKNPGHDPGEEVVIAAPKAEIHEEFPYYTGGVPLHLSRINQTEIDHTGYPRSRLSPVRQLPPTTLPLQDVRPSPFHVRTFDAADNTEFIESIKERGRPATAPLVRPVEGGFEIINGHKRIWASHAAGLTAVPCRCAYVDDRQAAERWARAHLPGYNDEQQQAAVARIRDEFGDDADAILP
jgi:ParB family chromosome partitioning protein